jgi:NlpC/P60 family/Bacterial dipeptidyl-peptidase Sh3 domain
MKEEGRVLRVIATPIAPMRKAADANSGLVTEALLGERVQVEDSDDAFVKAELEEDGYVGYLPRAMLGAPGRAPSHRITVAKTFRFSGPDIKSPPLGALYLNCRVAVSDGDADDRFAQLDGGGYVLRSTMVPLGTLAADPGAVAEGFVNAPYLWGGKSYEGLDCSGLVQLSLQACGIASPRDSHMIEAAVGRSLEGWRNVTLRRGDLVFWKGHVGMMLDGMLIIHANGHHMKVVIEPLSETIARIAGGHGAVTSVRRIEAVGSRQ